MSNSTPFDNTTDLPAGGPVRIMGGYQLIREVGAGAMGEVWLRRDIRLERHVAIKMMRCEIANDPLYIERFETEAKAVARLGHPNIVQIYSFGEEAGMVYFAMEWVNGKTLACRIREQGAIARKEALKMIQQAADALDYACKLGIIHRDIKPGNIMLDQAGRVKVADFGLAKLADQDSHMTATGAPMGSPNYMAPEACRGESLDHRADIYSLGVTFYQMLQGELPFAAPTPMSVMFKHVSEPLPQPESLRILDNGIWMDVLRKMTAKTLEERYRTYGELLEALDRLDSASTGTGQHAFASSSLYLGAGSGALTGTSPTLVSGLPAVNVSGNTGRNFNWRYGAMAAALVIVAAGSWYMYDSMNTKARRRVAMAKAVASPAPTANLTPSSLPNPASNTPPVTEIPQPIAGVAQAADSNVDTIAAMSPSAANALRDYDFRTADAQLKQTLQTGKIPSESRPFIEQLVSQLPNVLDFRDVLIAGATQRPGHSRMLHPTHGDLTLTGGSPNGFKFQSAGGIIEIPFRDVPPDQMVLMGRPHNEKASYKSKADVFLTLWPSIRSTMPPPGQQGNGPGGAQGPMGGPQGQAGNQGQMRGPRNAVPTPASGSTKLPQ